MEEDYYKVYGMEMDDVNLHVFQDDSAVEALPADAFGGAPDRDGAGGDGAQVHHRPHLQRLHLKLRVRRIHQTLPGRKEATLQLI